jgi:hemoglobin-like flavoprotein
MDDPIDDVRSRVLLEASLLTHEEWTTMLRAFYRWLLMHHPQLAGYFESVNIDFLVQKLVVVLTAIARERPDRAALDRVLFHQGVVHVERGIRRSEFNEFIALLASVLSGKLTLVGAEEAYAVWYQELSAVASAMLLTAA